MLSCSNKVPNMLEPVSRFLEHAQINNVNSQSGTDKKLQEPSNESLTERLKRVVNALLQLKDTVNRKAVSHLKDTFENALQGESNTL